MRTLSAEDGETKAGMNWKTPTFLAGFPSARHAGAGGELLPTFLLGYVPCTLKYMNMLGRCVRLYNTGSAIGGKINGLIIGFRDHYARGNSSLILFVKTKACGWEVIGPNEKAIPMTFLDQNVPVKLPATYLCFCP